MRINEATQLAKRFVQGEYPDEQLTDLTSEVFTYDDHLAVWTITVGFARQVSTGRPEYKVVRISNADKSLLSVGDK